MAVLRDRSTLLSSVATLTCCSVPASDRCGEIAWGKEAFLYTSDWPMVSSRELICLIQTSASNRKDSIPISDQTCVANQVNQR